MTRMIERWFPCAQVSANSRAGWGSGNSEAGLMTWFARRPTAQAKAATICSLLPWPDDPAEQQRLQDLVRGAMTGRHARAAELRAEILRHHPDGASTLDPFSGRGMIPLETARLDLPSFAIDYSPVAVLASRLLTDFPCRDWDTEPPLPYGGDATTLVDTRPRLVRDVERVLAEVGARYRALMAPYYPKTGGESAWGYLWAITIPCGECHRYFPLVGQLDLRKASSRKNRKTGLKFHDPGQSFYIDADRATGTWSAVVHDGPPQGAPTRQVPPGRSKYDSNGRVAVCPFCRSSHDRQALMRILKDGLGRDECLLAGDLDPDVGKAYRRLTQAERDAIETASTALRAQPRFSPFLAAAPDERIPDGNTWTVQATVYGTRTYGDMMNDRQTLSFIALARCIRDIGRELTKTGNGDAYVRALTGYAAAVLARKTRRATRGCTLDVGRSGVHDIFATESSLNFSFDYFEVGLADGPGSWDSVAAGSLTSLTASMPAVEVRPCEVSRGSAISLPFRDRTITAVVTDPPYDAMIDYTDASDLAYVWLKRALMDAWPELGITAHEFGVQEKSEEMIVKKGGTSSNDHRNREHYDKFAKQAFREAQRVVRDDGVVTIVFGHGDMDVWKRFLTAIQAAGLVLTGAWPAKTEAGGKVGSTNIVTTLTMACRPAPQGRPQGRKGAVEAAIKAEVRRRYPDWERWGLAPTDMLMAAAGPAMEVVGRYSQVLDARGGVVDIHTFLPLARTAVKEAMAVEIDHQPLDNFDARTQFALWWVTLYGRQPQAKSELRWQALASSLDLASVRDLVPDTAKGVHFTASSDYKRAIDTDSAVIDVVLALAAASADGMQAVGEVLAVAHRPADDTQLWAAIQFLANRLPVNDPDAVAFTRLLRVRGGVTSSAQAAVIGQEERARRREPDDAQLRLL